MKNLFCVNIGLKIRFTHRLRLEIEQIFSHVSRMKTENPHTADATPETYDALRARIRDRFDELPPHLQRIARSALDEPNHFALNTVVVIGEYLSVQPSTLIRFAKAFDYSGFSKMQRIFRLRLIEGAPDKRAQIYKKKLAGAPPKDMSGIFNDCIDDLIASLEITRAQTDTDTLAQAVAMIKSASHIHIAGLRRARPIATYLAYGLSRSELHCSLLDFGGGMAEQQVVNMGHDDLLICISFSPYTPSVLDVTRDAHLRRCPIIAITDSADSPLAKNSTVAFFAGNETTGQFKPISGAIGLVQSLCMGLAD